MKVLFTSMLMMIFAFAQGNNLPTDSLEKGKKEQVTAPIHPASNPSIVTMEMLQQENAQLKARLVALENRFEEEKSMLQYKLTMLSLINRLEFDRKSENMEDLKSQVNFNQTMSNTLFMLQKMLML
jgi:hypothetical protein